MLRMYYEYTFVAVPLVWKVTRQEGMERLFWKSSSTRFQEQEPDFTMITNTMHNVPSSSSFNVIHIRVQGTGELRHFVVTTAASGAGVKGTCVTIFVFNPTTKLSTCSFCSTLGRSPPNLFYKIMPSANLEAQIFPTCSYPRVLQIKLLK